jgi:hypothetical protein
VQELPGAGQQPASGIDQFLALVERFFSSTNEPLYTNPYSGMKPCPP